MIGLLALAAVSWGQPSEIDPQPGVEKQRIQTETVVTTRTVGIPRMIYRDISPYYDCVIAKSNAELRARDFVSNDTFAEVRAEVLQACADVRAKAKSGATKELRKSRLAPSQRAETAENVLLSIEENLLTPPTLVRTSN